MSSLASHRWRSVLAESLLPPVIARGLRKLLRPANTAPSTPDQINLLELDERLTRCEEAGKVSADAQQREFASFVLGLSSVPGLASKLASDPFGNPYAEAQADLFSKLRDGRPYSAPEDETTPFDLHEVETRPYPYFTGSSEITGDQLIMQGNLLRSLKIESLAGHRVLEFGPGWGHTTLHLAALGAKVTAVDIYQPFLDLIQARATRQGLEVEIQQADMLSFEASEPYDTVLFFESFHHCTDHRRMIERLHQLVRPGGQVIFGGEPIVRTENPALPYPWGFRLDGITLWSIRRSGWYELGFTESYFREALRRAGWRSEFAWSHDVPHHVTVRATRL